MPLQHKVPKVISAKGCKKVRQEDAQVIDFLEDVVKEHHFEQWQGKFLHWEAQRMCAGP